MNQILSLALMRADLRPDDRVDAQIRVELWSGHFRQVAAILERRTDGALRVSGDSGWLQTEEDCDGQWLTDWGSDPCVLARAIDEKRWGAFQEKVRGDGR